MRLLVIYCHPCADSFNAAIYRTTQQALTAAGHDLRCHDLYAEGFQPVMTAEERQNYLTTTEPLMTRNAGHVADLRWAEGLIVIYPTWYYGPPAMLKGWLECVWLPGVTFEVAPEPGALPKALLSNIRLFIGVTTSGSPWWWLRLIRDPGRNLWLRGLRPIFHRRCRFVWRQLHDMNHATEGHRTAFLAKVERTMREIREPRG
jgi:NAD(P)H dehydrogenase (quinone)